MILQRFWERLCTAVGTLGLTAFAVAAFTPVARPLSRWMATAPDAGDADAVVVLGAAVDPDGRLQDSSLRRAVEGIALQREGRAPRVLMLGPCDTDACEADIRARLAHRLGLPADVVMRETRGLTTALEARWAADRLLPDGSRRVILVTSALHLWRARRIFEREGFEVLAAPVEETATTSHAPDDRLAAIAALLRELAARGLYRLRGQV